jgi:hypothetical protein
MCTCRLGYGSGNNLEYEPDRKIEQESGSKLENGFDSQLWLREQTRILIKGPN